MSEKIAIEEDTLFLACTRPAMIGGVTMEAMGINMIFTTILFIVAGSAVYALVGLVLHVIFKAIVKHDHNMFRVLLGWIETQGRSRNKGVWGGSSLTPMKLVRRYDERDLCFA